MKMNLLEIGEMIIEDDIRKLETKMNLKLPEEYRNFLLQNNGGVPENDVEFSFIELDVVTQENREQGSDIQYFYNVDEMLEAYQNLVDEELIHKNYIPVACDSFGNEILICSDSDENNGCVFFANHEMVNPDGSFWITSKIANSFNEFINILVPIEY